MNKNPITCEIEFYQYPLDWKMLDFQPDWEKDNHITASASFFTLNRKKRKIRLTDMLIFNIAGDKISKIHFFPLWSSDGYNCTHELLPVQFNDLINHATIKNCKTSPCKPEIVERFTVMAKEYLTLKKI
jgi:hypothetical protein